MESWESAKWCAASPICFRLFVQEVLLAASLAACTAGSRSPTRMPMMAITTSSSTNVKPGNGVLRRNNFVDRIPNTSSMAFDVLPEHEAVILRIRKL